MLLLLEMKCFILLCILGLPSGYEDKTIIEYLVDNGYSTLYSELKSASLEEDLNSDGPFTIFAPTEDAFRGVSLNGLTTDQLASILKYHVVRQFVLVPLITKSTIISTLDNQTLTVEPSEGGLVINKGTSNPATVASGTGKNDVIVSNGVIQPIDAVLMPTVLPTVLPTTPSATYNIYQLLLRDDLRFSDFTIVLLLAELLPLIQSTELTVFAPTNAAFEFYKDNLPSQDDPNAKTIYQEVLKYHMVPGGRLASQLKTGVLHTLHGTSLNVTAGSGVMINNANVIDADIMATNGVIHAIDHLLIPQDIDQIISGDSGTK